MKCPSCKTEGAYVGMHEIECMRKDCEHYHDPKMPDPVEVCNRIMDNFLKQTEQKEEISAADAVAVTEIQKTLKSITIVKLGDVKNGLYPSKKAFDKIKEMLRNKINNPWDEWIIVWDDLVDKCIVNADDKVEIAN